jgi:ParB-like chromosome segregation protein Spo0J
MTLQKIAPELLIEDLSLYPRRHIDSSHVNDLTRVLQAGGEFDFPPVVDEASKRIVDGFHRVRAAIKVGREEIEVDMRQYDNEAALLEDAIQPNAKHGLKLSSTDQTRSILLLDEHNISDEGIAKIMQTTEERVRKLRQRVVYVRGEGPRPAKPAYWSKEGEPPLKVKRADVALIEAAPGWRHRQTIKHVANDLRAGLVDLADENVVEALEDLRGAIDEAL